MIRGCEHFTRNGRTDRRKKFLLRGRTGGSVADVKVRGWPVSLIIALLALLCAGAALERDAIAALLGAAALALAWLAWQLSQPPCA